MKFEEVVTSPTSILLQDYIHNHTTAKSFRELLQDNTERTHAYFGEDVIIIPATKQRIFEGSYGLRYINNKNRVQIGNMIIYKATDEIVENILNKEVENA